jgi:hypothetical protein
MYRKWERERESDEEDRDRESVIIYECK